MPVAADDVAVAGLLASRATTAGLTIVGPEAPLVLGGIVRYLPGLGLRVLRPDAGAAQLGGSKAFTKDFLARHNIPTAATACSTNSNRHLRICASAARRSSSRPTARRQSKGVIVARRRSRRGRRATCSPATPSAAPAAAWSSREFLSGGVLSFIVSVDGEHVLPMATSQDHKRATTATGPNTGGMGAYSPAPVVTPAVFDRAMSGSSDRRPVRGMAAEGHPYTGFLYAGLMIAADGTPEGARIQLRFGSDPETQPILMRLRSDLVDLCETALAGQLHESTPNGTRARRSAWSWPPAATPTPTAKGDAILGLPESEIGDAKFFHAGTTCADDGRAVTRRRPRAVR